MLILEKYQLPKEYERTILEEYYNFFAKIFGPTNIFGSVPKFTTDESKLDLSDKYDNNLRRSIEAYNSIKEEDIAFLLFGEEEIMTTIARISLLNNTIRIAEILFLDYPTDEEKKIRMGKIFNVLNYYGMNLGFNKIVYEIPKKHSYLQRVNDDFTMQIALDNGFTQVDEPLEDVKKNIFDVFEKMIDKDRVNDEWTRNLKQTERKN